MVIRGKGTKWGAYYAVYESGAGLPRGRSGRAHTRAGAPSSVKSVRRRASGRDGWGNSLSTPSPSTAG